MARVAGWLSAVAFLSLPVILYFGRPSIPCNQTPWARRHGLPCVGPAITPAWSLPTLVIVFTSAIALASVYVWVLLANSDWPGRHGPES
jgi:hypothetical protein